MNSTNQTMMQILSILRYEGILKDGASLANFVVADHKAIEDTEIAEDNPVGAHFIHLDDDVDVSDTDDSVIYLGLWSRFRTWSQVVHQ